MSIILRTLKGSALTYEEMDRNMSQLFYSSSIHNSGSELRLHYTGSDSLDTGTEDYGPDRYQSVSINGGTTTTVISGSNPDGPNGAIQYNNNGVFGGSSRLYYDNTRFRVGIGTDLVNDRLHIVSDINNTATIRLATSGVSTPTNKAQIVFYNGTTRLGQIGKTDTTDTQGSNIYLEAVNKLNLQINSNTISTLTSIGLGIFDSNTNRQLSVLGAEGIGVQKTGDRGTQSIIRPIPSTVYQSNVLGSNINEYGVMLSGPLTSTNSKGGHVVISLSEYSSRTPTTGENSFSIISSTDETYASATSIATFKSNQRVGIATNAPSVTLDVNGQMRGKYTINPVDTQDLGIATSKIVKAPITGDITFTSGEIISGIEATVIIEPNILSTNTVSFDTNFKVQGNLTVAKSKTYTISFVSDGNYWYETSRTTYLG